MMKKEEYIKKLHEDEVFKSVVSKATSDADRRAIQAFTEEFMVSFVDVLEQLHLAAAVDPQGFQKTLSELDGQLLLTGSLEL